MQQLWSPFIFLLFSQAAHNLLGGLGSPLCHHRKPPSLDDSLPRPQQVHQYKLAQAGYSSLVSAMGMLIPDSLFMSL